MRMLAVSALLTVLFVVAPNARAAPDESQALEVLKSDYPEAKHWPGAAERSVEFCGGDWCQQVVSVGATSTREAWDAVFVLFYFLDPDEDYTKRRRDAAENIVARSAKHCLARSGDLRASCVLDSLQKKFGFEYRRVQYDVGHRCHSEIAVKPPFFTKKGGCARMEKGAFRE
ncbi:hypothetical protein [Lysobacter enzymogenes]|uniref:Uncharacterized protein n=1 Tax=Lysobacter enzymogenes TaxID=69 RepID=A0A3N2RBD5_LYSEN|nr:hypothetical protein [Lysobacter enzymogenes]ROU04727.1 hypothetical protein D9T17_21610 [Lysobacter enzymogenes]